MREKGFNGRKCGRVLLQKIVVSNGDRQRILKMVFVTCLCFLTMCKESSESGGVFIFFLFFFSLFFFFLKASSDLKKEASFQRVNFLPAMENVTAVEKCLPSSETLFMPAVCTSSSFISLTTTIQVCLFRGRQRGPYSCLCVYNRLLFCSMNKNEEK